MLDDDWDDPFDVTELEDMDELVLVTELIDDPLDVTELDDIDEPVPVTELELMDDSLDVIELLEELLLQFIANAATSLLLSARL